jgi:hypothetical protein
MFCSPLAMVMVNGEQVTAAQFSQPLAMVKVAFGEAPTPGMAPTAAMPTDGPSPSNNLAREGSVHRVIGTSLDGNGSYG